MPKTRKPDFQSTERALFWVLALLPTLQLVSNISGEVASFQLSVLSVSLVAYLAYPVQTAAWLPLSLFGLPPGLAPPGLATTAAARTTCISVDPLTVLANRRALYGALDAALVGVRPHTPLPVMRLDLDHFKAINFKAVNDRFCHQTGDEVPERLTERADRNLYRAKAAERNQVCGDQT
ncbi:diguanylate cyclase [Deinococcus sp.]|uniref:diguanylate cyclase n=1 Tax=Deinococcus sp. TaxID=47478 RepID=UPI0025E26AD1|nr:diguanylate cyclase [Deinococcus sp.]